MNAPALELRNVTSGYGKQAILHGVSLAVATGEILAVVGLNGSGKSVLARTVSGVVPLLGGSISVSGRDVTKTSAARRVRSGVHHLSQRRGLVPELTVAENVRLTAFAGRTEDRSPSLAGFPAVQALADRRAGTLSGGEQAMVALARASLARPLVLVADEPTAGLSPVAAVEHEETFRTLRDGGTAVLLIEQNASFALRVADRVLALRSGVVAFEAETRGVSERDLLDALLG